MPIDTAYSTSPVHNERTHTEESHVMADDQIVLQSIDKLLDEKYDAFSAGGNGFAQLMEVPADFETVYQSSKMQIGLAVNMQCRMCERVFSTNDFIDHILRRSGTDCYDSNFLEYLARI